jgi:hypothetical protein
MSIVSKRRKGVYLCYFDESGDAGVPSRVKSPTKWFVLNCLFVHESDWLDVLDALVALRRELRDSYGISPRDELKGAHFRTGEGAFFGLSLSRDARMDIYKDIMNRQSALPIKTFSIAIEKDGAHARGWDIRYVAWTFAFQRLDTQARTQDEWCSIYPDEGHGFFIRQRLRAMRRHHMIPKHFGPGTFPLPTKRILEDPNDRRSQDSYRVQLADLNAFATHRSSYIHPLRKMSSDMWDALGTPMGEARQLEVNRNRPGPPGIVVYP